jgi:ribosome-binding factor A
MPNRIEKVNSLLQREISALMVREFSFSHQLVTLTRVEATANLIEARAYVSVMPEDKADHVIDVLNKGVYDLQQKINKKLNMRPIPRIKFYKDTQIASASKIEKLIDIETKSLKKEQK